MGASSPHSERSSNVNGEVNERTPLLANASDSHHHGTASSKGHPTGTERTESSEPRVSKVPPNSESNTPGMIVIGLEVESQETALLRRPEGNGAIRDSSRGLDRASNGRKSIESTAGDGHDITEEEDLKSPFLGGVGVVRFWLIFGGILFSHFVACFDGTIMVSSHPVITSYFHGANSASWLSTAFLLTSTSFQPLFGRLSDTVGRKPPYIFCLAVFLIATVWCALAQSMTSFIAARALCGLGAGGAMSLGSIITSDLVPIEIRGAYQSYINIVFGAGSALGAALGGAIADHLGWRWEFGIQLPFLVLCLLIACFTTPKRLGLLEGAQQKSVLEAMKTFDFKGSILLTTSITFLILGLSLGGNIYAWSHPFVVTSLVIFVISFPLFIWVESRVPLPIMPLNLIINNPRAGLIISNSLGAVIVNTVMFNIPLYFQAVLLESATSSGLRLVVPTLFISVFGTATGFLITWTRRLKWPLVLGVINLLFGSAALSLMTRGLPDWSFLLFLIPSNIGQGFMFPATFMAVLAVSKQSEQAVVTSTLILWRSLGTVLGVSLSSLVLQNALFYFLELKVKGPEKDQIISSVRKSIKVIKDLDPIYREQVIDAYALSLRSVFVMAAILSAVAVVITVKIQLPRLGQRKK